MQRETLLFLFFMSIFLLQIFSMPHKKQVRTDKDAKLRSGREFKRLLSRWDKQDDKIILTKNIQIPLNNNKIVSNHFALLMAGSGSGKSDSVIKNNIIASPSVDKIITDVGGVLLPEFKEYLLQSGYEVLHLDLLNFDCEFQFNPLLYIRTRKQNETQFLNFIGNRKVEYTEELDLDFIDNVISKALVPVNAKDDFWNELTRNILSLLIQVLIYMPGEYYQKNRNINMAVYLFSLIFEKDEEGTGTKLDDIIFDLEYELTEYIEDKDGKKHLQLNMDLPASSVILSYRTIRNQLVGRGDFSNSMRGCFSTYLNIFTKPTLKRMTSTDNLNLQNLGSRQGKRAIFIQTNEAQSSYTQVISLFYSVIFNLIIFNSISNKRNRLDRNVLLILEEAGNYVLPSLSKILATTRKRGVSAVIAIQSVSQLYDLYGKSDTETILSNCAIKDYIAGTTSLSNLELLQKIGGETKYQMEGTSSSKGQLSGKNFSETYHPLLTANYINSLCPYYSIVIVGSKVYEDKNMYYKNMPEWKKYFSEKRKGRNHK